MLPCVECRTPEHRCRECGSYYAMVDVPGAGDTRPSCTVNVCAECWNARTESYAGSVHERINAMENDDLYETLHTIATDCLDFLTASDTGVWMGDGSALDQCQRDMLRTAAFIILGQIGPHPATNR